MKTAVRVLGLVVVALAVPQALGQEAAKFTVLTGDNAQAVSRQCSRPGPPAFKATWEPSVAEIKELEAKLPQIQKLASTQCCKRGARVPDVNKYYRQYAGIVVGSRKLIYINAFSRGNKDAERDSRWRREPILACDGGRSFWGAMYDPATKRFWNLAFNGDA